MDPTATPGACAANICIKASVTSAGVTLQAVSLRQSIKCGDLCERQRHTVDRS